ncbi:hypothetical protein GWK47_001207 [Chionoecetes opilio]|uniref:Uncharacterized protein n=1 Tax=Chionoecetes opilio TaxID=41210 RepID=A0A8J5CQ45_CHIOP|nr:hypothetical protein GWK47_001207 [Chionoecetes opilio]
MGGVVFPLLAGCHWWRKKIYEVLRCFHRLSLRGNPEGPSSRSRFKIPKSGQRKAEGGLNTSMGYPFWTYGGQANQSKFVDFCSIPKSKHLHLPVFEALVSKQKADLFPDAASSTPSKPLHHGFLPRRIGLPGPQEGKASFPLWGRAAMRSSLSPERDGRSFPSQSRTTSQDLPGFPQFHIFQRVALPPQICARWGRALRDRPYSQCPFPKA